MNDDFKKGLITGLSLQPLNVTVLEESKYYHTFAIELCGIISEQSYCEKVNFEGDV